MGTIDICIDVCHQRGRHCRQHDGANTCQDVGRNLNAIKQKVQHCRIRREQTRSSKHRPQIWSVQGIKRCNQGSCVYGMCMGRYGKTLLKSCTSWVITKRAAPTWGIGHVRAQKVLITLRESISTIWMQMWNSRKPSLGSTLTELNEIYCIWKEKPTSSDRW